MSEKNRIIIHGMAILQGKEWYPNEALVIEDNKIAAIIQDSMVKHHLPAQQFKFSPEDYLIPGLIDLHVHGAAGHDVMDADSHGLQTMAQALAKEGVTGFLATTMTMGKSQIEAAIKSVADTMAKPNSGVLGIHLEGPFIAKEKIGAQDPAHLQLPDDGLIKHWQHLSNKAIRIVTFAPELPNAIEFIHCLKNLGIVAGIGHTNATYDQTKAAINAGATYATHLFNAMRLMTQREPGASGALLLDDRVMAELIVDQIHLHPAIVEIALKIKTELRLILISDSMRGKGLEAGSYELGGQQVNVENGKVTLENGTLAGSTLRLPDAIRAIADYKNVSLIDAILLATKNPAHVIGVYDQKGSIEVGKDADLVVLSKDLNVMMTIRGGEVVFKTNESKAYVAEPE